MERPVEIATGAEPRPVFLNMKTCQTTSELQADGRWLHCCANCGVKSYHRRPHLAGRPCAGKLPEGPGAARVVLNYSAAMVRWLAAGKPVRSPDEIMNLVRICQGCDFYIDNACRKCGCKVNASPSGLQNKAAMATEHCPLAKW